MTIPPLLTSRLTIRPFEAADWQAVHAYMSDEETTAYLPEDPFTPAQSRAFMHEQGGPEPRAWAIEPQADRRVVGHLLFHPWFAPQTYEVGWVLHKQHRQQGYATEAARAVVRYAFEQLDAHRVIATCQPDNVASWRVMEKLGMRREGHFRQALHRGGDVWWDEYFYAILAEEWAVGL